MFLNEIHGLRGLAILFVLLYHFFPEVFFGGWLGVDIFFAISGYLVTTTVLNYPPHSRIPEFLATFYSRRIARILPSCILICTIALFLSFLLQGESNVSRIVTFYISAVLGFANINLYLSNDDYFATDQEFNFFTQTWSLGIEEQFYLLFSILFIILVYKRSGNNDRNFYEDLFYLFLGITVVSLLVNIWHSVFNIDNNVFSFYLLPTRLWELSAGAALAVYVTRYPSTFPELFTEQAAFIKWMALVLLVIALFIPYKPIIAPFPATLLVVIPSLFICALADKHKSDHVYKFFNIRSLQILGSISFTLYLLHWVLLVALKHTFDDGNLAFRFLFLFVSIGLSTIIFYYYEKPVNNYLKFHHRWSLTFGLIVLSVLISVEVLNRNDLIKKNPFWDIQDKAEWEAELLCHGSQKVALYDNPLDECLKPDPSSPNKNVIYMNGDSHMAALYYMVKAVADKINYQIRYINTESVDDSYGFLRITKNIYLEENPAVMEYFSNHVNKGDIVFLTFAGYRFNRNKMDDELFREALDIWNRYFEKFRRKNVNVILVLDAPTFERNPVTKCVIARKFFENPKPCIVSAENAHKKRAKQEKFFKALRENNANVYVWDLMPYFCNQERCSMYSDKNLLFYDYHHINKTTSLSLADDFIEFLFSNKIAEEVH